MAAAAKSYSFLDPPAKPGDLGQLGHYRVLSELGKGGMGYVFRAEDAKLKRSVALKVMNQKIAATPNARRRFLHEARAMAAVHHDNVVTIFEVGESKGTPFMAMEMLRGSTLEDWNSHHRQFEYEQIIEFARQMTRGLAAAHAQGIVHRDIKPANIWIEQDSDRVKILDFGLALASSPVDQLAGRGAVIGTPGYLSPEQARSEPLDDRTDLYSLGVVLYELSTGQLPFTTDSVTGHLISILAHRPTPIDELNADIPAPLCELIHRLLRKEPRSRPRSASWLLTELDRVETECHSKSEVAQAINKLQLGLQEVVSKQTNPSIFDLETPIEVLPDPLESFAPSQPAAVPVAMPAPARPATANRPAVAAPTWQTYWPFAVVIAVALLALAGLIFVFTRGDSSTASLAGEDATSSSPIPITPPVEASQDGPGGAPESNAEARQNSQSTDAARFAPAADSEQANRNQTQADQAPPSAPRSGNGQRRQRGTQRGGQREPSMVNALPSAAPSDTSPSPSTETTPAAVPSPSPPESSRAASDRAQRATDAEAPPQVAPVEREPPMKWTAISTADGRGADAMVQSGSKQKYGNKPSIGIRTRSDVESNHSYLRFDLAEIEETRRWTSSAELILSVVGNDRPVGAKLRVFALDVGLWAEDSLDWKTSYSPRGLDANLSMVAETIVTAEGDPSDEDLNVIRISSPELAKAVAEATHDTLTLVLAGSAADSSLLRFVSREQSASAAPKLVVRTPAEPLEAKQGRSRGRR